ncbi:hypothetical protein LBMAG10_09320 [Actinomycetes bacterium]|nr:hypothetical protein LBMAG10_09320 [Actinomycetes bacterium]
MATTSLLKREIKLISVISLSALLWTLTPDAFAVSGKNKNIKTAPKTAGRTSQAPTLNTLLNGLGAPNSTDGIDGDFYLDTLSSNLYGPKKKGKWPLPKSLVGPVGPQGPIGKQGSDGKVGDKGTSTSSAGSQGTQGTQGTQGIQGVQGASGPAGPSGPSGPQGPGGGSGGVGPQGNVGPAGSPGGQGVPGATGTTGARGPIGETGTVGADGAQGTAGPSRAVLGNINFVGTLSGNAGTGKESSAFGDFQTGKKYLVISNIFTTSTSTVDPSIGIAISVSGAALTPISKFITISGNGYRLSIENFEYGVQVFTTVDASAISGPNFNLKATVSSGANTSTTGFALVVTGFYVLQEVVALT